MHCDCDHPNYRINKLCTASVTIITLFTFELVSSPMRSSSACECVKSGCYISRLVASTTMSIVYLHFYQYVLPSASVKQCWAMTNGAANVCDEFRSGWLKCSYARIHGNRLFVTWTRNFLQCTMNKLK